MKQKDKKVGGVYSSPQIIAQTQQWLADFVIAYNICPFAKREFVSKRIAYEVIQAADVEAQLHALIDACRVLDTEKHLETSLLIYPHGLDDFDDYLDFLEIANALLQKQGYEGIYQLASFHPDYCFAEVPAEDASHYTNRSPYPMLHLIREASLEQALKNYPDPDNIPLRNIDKTRELGVAKLQQLLANCLQIDK